MTSHPIVVVQAVPVDGLPEADEEIKAAYRRAPGSDACSPLAAALTAAAAGRVVFTSAKVVRYRQCSPCCCLPCCCLGAISCGTTALTTMPVVLESSSHECTGDGPLCVLLNSACAPLVALAKSAELQPRSKSFGPLCRRLAALLADYAQWPSCMPIAQMGGFGGGDFGIIAFADVEEGDMRPVTAALTRARPNASALVPRGCRVRARLGEAFTLEIAHLQEQLAKGVPLGTIAGQPDTWQQPTAQPVVIGRPLGTGLIAYSPQFARFVRGSDGTMPDPNGNPILALSLLLSVPVIDRTGVITDPDVKVTVLE